LPGSYLLKSCVQPTYTAPRERTSATPEGFKLITRVPPGAKVRRAAVETIVLAARTRGMIQAIIIRPERAKWQRAEEAWGLF
jgi:hypothetical protein